MYTPSVTFDEYFCGEQSKYPQLKRQDVQKLRDSLDKEKVLPQISDKKLVAFLHSCYFDVELARITAIKCYKSYFEVSKVFCELDPSAEEMLKNYDCTSFGELTYDVCNQDDRYVYWQFKDTDPEKFNYMAIFKVVVMWMEYGLLTKGTFDGLTIVINTSGLNWRHIIKLPVGVASKLLTFLQQGLPIRLKSVQVLNAGHAARMLLKLITPFVGKELMNKIIFHAPGSAEIYDYVPKEILPSEVAGLGKSHNFYNDEMYKNITSCRDWFLEQNHDLKKQMIINGENV